MEMFRVRKVSAVIYIMTKYADIYKVGEYQVLLCERNMHDRIFYRIQ